jgi:hypothetical protein
VRIEVWERFVMRLAPKDCWIGFSRVDLRSRLEQSPHMVTVSAANWGEPGHVHRSRSKSKSQCQWIKNGALTREMCGCYCAVHSKTISEYSKWERLCITWKGVCRPLLPGPPPVYELQHFYQMPPCPNEVRRRTVLKTVHFIKREPWKSIYHTL